MINQNTSSIKETKVLIFFNRHDKGAHFAAWEQPEYLTADVRATFRSLR